MTALPLTGRRVAVTAERRRGELVALLERAGAQVVEAPAMRLVPLEDDAVAREATRRCVAAPLDDAVAMTGVGFRGWLAAADDWGLGDRLRATLAGARLLARGPKARGAVRGAGLTEAWHAGSEASDEVLAHLLAEPVTGRRVAVQLHGEPQPAFVEPLRAAGADVVEVPLYRWEPPADLDAVRRLVAAVADRDVDAVAFTSGPQVRVLLAEAASAGRLEAVVSAFASGDVLPAVIGPVCARPFEQVGVTATWPERYRLADLARLVGERLSVRP